MKRIIPALLLLCVLAVSAAVRPPLMGWSSWNTYRVGICDSLILRQAQALRDLGLDTLGYRQVNIDDGFFGGRDASGRLLFHPVRFPHGLKGLVDSIHAMGLRAGIYSDAGANTCGNFWDNDTIARGVGLYGHEEEDCRLFFDSLGFDFIKVDFCGGDAFQNTEGLALDPEQRYRAIRRAAGDSVAINVCRWSYPGTWVAEVGDSWRISPDISCSWLSVRDIIDRSLCLSAYADGRGHNDMDMLEIGRTLSPEEERTHFAIWCIMSSPLLIGCDLTELPAASLALLGNRELIAVNQDPLGLQAYAAARQQGGYVLVKDLEQREGLRRAVALYNPTDSGLTMTLRFADIDLGGRVSLRNLLERRDEGVFADSVSFDVPPRGTRIFTASAERRLERRLYEAETAFMTAFQEIYSPIHTATPFYQPDSLASGGFIAANLGARPLNDIAWEHVAVRRSGLRTLTFSFVNESGSSARVLLSVNEGPAELLTVPAGRNEVAVKCCLREGGNRVRLYNDREPMPGVDCLTID